MKAEFRDLRFFGPVDRYLVLHRNRVTWWLAGFIFVSLFLSFGFALNQPPTWDGAMSVYPAAIELVKSGFDIPEVLEMPTYLEGGPNTHTTSPWTLMVAVLIQTTGSLPDALPILHGISFALSALTAAAAYRLIAHTAPGFPAVIGALATLIFPPMLVQTTDIYLDLPLTCAGTWALVFLQERRYGGASLLTTLAVLVKPLAILFVGVLALHVLTEGSRTGRRRRLAATVSPPLTAAVAVALVQSSIRSAETVADRLIGALTSTAQHLLALPDVVLLLVVVLGSGVAWRRNVRDVEVYRIATMMIMSLVGFALLSPVVTQGISLLPRYYIAATPVLIAGTVALLANRSRVLSVAVGAGIAILFAINAEGIYYPYQDHPASWIAERSFTYRDVLALQKEDSALLAELGRHMPVYYDYGGYYRFTYPELGYSSGPIPTGISVAHHPELLDRPLSEMPDRFAFMYEYPIPGNEMFFRWQEEATAAGVYVNEIALTRGNYTVYVIEIDRTRLADSQ